MIACLGERRTKARVQQSCKAKSTGPERKEPGGRRNPVMEEMIKVKSVSPDRLYVKVLSQSEAMIASISPASP